MEGSTVREDVSDALRPERKDETAPVNSTDQPNHPSTSASPLSSTVTTGDDIPGADSILKESSVVQMQRAAKAELERRRLKTEAEEAVTVTADGSSEAKRRSRFYASSAQNGGRNANRVPSKEENQTSITSSWIKKTSQGPQEDDSDRIIDLRQLNRNIEKRLSSKDTLWDSRDQLPRAGGTVQPPVRDSMSSLLSYNHVEGDWRLRQSATTYNVAVVFGKPLVRDQITVEYSSRIRTLARLFKDNPLFRPSIICFTGCTAAGNHVADADAGFIFFRHMCEAQGIDLDGVEVLIDSISQNEADAVYRVTEDVRSTYVPRWLDAAPIPDGDDEKKITVHFSLISTEYHLCNLNDVHQRSPRQSLLKPIETMSGDSSGGRPRHLEDNQLYGFGSPGSGNDVFYDDLTDRGDTYNPLMGRRTRPKSTQELKGIVKSSWSFQYATYPFLYAQDEAVVFLGKCYLLSEELMPLLVNMKGVVEEEEFFQRDNYLMVASIRRSLVSKVESLQKPHLGVKRALKRYIESEGMGSGSKGLKDLNSVLEGALLSLGRCVDLVRPAGLLVSSVPSENWNKALRSLEHSMSEIRRVCDPDRPLRPTEWGKLVDSEDTMLDIGILPMQHFMLWKDKLRHILPEDGQDSVNASEEESEDLNDIFSGYSFSWLTDE